MEENLRLNCKSELILGGGVKLPSGFQVPVRISKSTAGPGAGFGSIALEFDGCRVKKSISYEEGEFELVPAEENYSLFRDGNLFLENVKIIPVVYHCPEQAFFNLDQRCIFNCAFCASPRLDKDSTKGLTDEKIVEMISLAKETQDVPVAALTSGVVGSVDETVERFVSCVKAIKSNFPEMIVGVEPYVSTREHIIALKEAGADEIKINIESATSEIFEKACPELNRTIIFERLMDSVEIFGKGKVTSNLIVGLGETDEEIEKMIREMASKGIVVGLRPLKRNSINDSSMMKMLNNPAPNTTERLIKLSKLHKEILNEYGLSSESFETMCMKCTCCDLVPFRDF